MPDIDKDQLFSALKDHLVLKLDVEGTYENYGYLTVKLFWVEKSYPYKETEICSDSIRTDILR